MKVPNKVFWAKALGLLAVVASMGYAFQSRFQIGIDPQKTLSMEKRVFLIDTKDQHLERGGIFVFKTQGAEPVYADGTELVKRVVGMPGDRVEITPYFDILVNGERVARGLWHLRQLEQGEVRKKFTGTRVLNDNEYWVTGRSFKSFDSRYFGPITSAQIKGRAYGLF